MGLVSRWLGIDEMLKLHHELVRDVLHTAQIQAEAARIQAEASLELSKHFFDTPDEVPDQWVSSPDLPFEPDITRGRR